MQGYFTLTFWQAYINSIAHSSQKFTRDPLHDSDKNYSVVEGFVWGRYILDQTFRQKRKDWWSRLLSSLNIVRKQTLLVWVMLNGFKVFRKEPKCHKCNKWHKAAVNLQELEVLQELFCTAVGTSRSEFFIGECFTEKLICCLSWSWREFRLISWLSPEIPKFDNLMPSTQTNRIELEDIIMVPNA